MAGEEAGEDKERAGIMEGTMEGSGKVLQAGGRVEVHGATALNAAPRGVKKMPPAVFGPVVNAVDLPGINTSILISKPR